MAKFISTFLTFLLLLSSSSLSYAQHFCGGNEVLAKVTVGEKHLDCGMAMDEAGCCDNQYTNVDTDESHAAITFDFSLENHLELFQPKLTASFKVENFKKVNDFYVDYSPPPIGIELYILYDTFLI